MKDIEYAEVRLNDGDGNDYINFYVDDITHSYLLEDVFEQMQSTSQTMPCGHLERYQVQSDNTQYCSLCALIHAHCRDHKHDPLFCDPCKYIGKIIQVVR